MKPGVRSRYFHPVMPILRLSADFRARSLGRRRMGPRLRAVSMRLVTPLLNLLLDIILWLMSERDDRSGIPSPVGRPHPGVRRA